MLSLKPFRTAALSLALFSFSIAAWASRPIAILGIASEMHTLLPHIKQAHTITLLNVPFTTGMLKGENVVAARCGAGKVNAAMTATLLIDHFHPREIIFTGSAGGLNPALKPGDVVIGSKTAEHDYGTITAAGMDCQPTDGIGEKSRNPLYFPADPALLALAQKAAAVVKFTPVNTGSGPYMPHVMTGIILTGDVFVAYQKLNDMLRTKMGGDAVEMEGAAVAQVCWEEQTPFLAIRSISDNANSHTPVLYDRFYTLAARNSAKLVMTMLSLMHDAE